MTRFGLIFIGFATVLACWEAHDIERRVTALELRCDGRCQYGDTACKAHCDKLGHCPMEAK